MIFKSQTKELLYEDFGHGPAVAVLHDHPSNQELRAAVFEALAEAGFRVIIVNPGGLGNSKPAALSAKEQTDQVLSLFNYLGIGRAALIGIAQGGYVAMDLLERFPARVATASFVVSADLAADLRRRASSKNARQALRKGQCEDLKGAFLTTHHQSPSLPQLPRVRAWINNLRERRQAGLERRHQVSAGFELPPLVIEEESLRTTPSSATRPGSRSFRPLRALSAPLQALLNALLPDESLFEEEAEEVLSDHR